jgi:DNA-binding XRE family transcriptional regulator
MQPASQPERMATSKRPVMPTPYRPGEPERFAVMEERARLGLPLRVDGDAILGSGFEKKAELTTVNTINFPEILHRQRVRAGLSMRQLAVKAGLTHVCIYYLELGRRSPTLEALQRLARGLGITLFELLGGPSPPTPLNLSIEDG